MHRLCRIILVTHAFTLTVSCGGKPPLEQPGGVESRTVSIDYLKSMYVSAPMTINENIRIEGRVVSDDRNGNFYKTLYLEDATGGIALRLDMTDIFKTYRYGYNVAVNCNSLTLGSYGGAIQLGAASADGKYQVDPIPAVNILSHLVPEPDSWEEPLPAVRWIGELSVRYINCYVRFDVVQFIDEEVGHAWCDDGEDTNRHIIDRDGNALIVRTGGHAGFAGRQLPSGSGFITGVLGYFNGNYQLVLSTDADALMSMTGERF